MRKEIKTKKDLDDMVRMIEKECQRNSLTDLCEGWDFECSAFYEFIGMAELYFDLSNS